MDVLNIYFIPSFVYNFYREYVEDSRIEYEILHWMIEVLIAEGIHAQYELDEANCSRINVSIDEKRFSIILGTCGNTKPYGHKRFLLVTRINNKINDYQDSMEVILNSMFKSISSNPDISSCLIP